MTGGVTHLRAAFLAVLIALITAAGHLAGGGSLPDLGLVAVLLPLLAALLVTAARRCTGVFGTGVTLAGGQLSLHLLLLALHPGTHAAVPAVGGAGMLAMHALATVVIAVLMRGADRALDAVHAALGRVVRRRLGRPPVAVGPQALAVAGAPVPMRVLMLAAAPLVRRGPPVGC